MAEFMKFINGVLHGDVCFFRAVHDWELEALLGFMDTINLFFYPLIASLRFKLLQ